MLLNAEVAESLLQAPGCNIPHLAVGHRLRYGMPEGVFATWDSGQLPKPVNWPRGCLPIVFLIPLRKLPQPFSQCNLRRKPEITLEGGSIGIGGGDVAGLHRHELLVGLEVVVGGEDAGADEFLLEDVDKVQQVLGLAAADVVDGIRGDGQAVLAGPLFRGLAHHPDDAFHDVIDIGEIASAVAVVVDLDGLAFQQLVREPEIGHVRAARRAVDGEEAEARGRDIVKLGIAVGEEFVALLGRRIQAHRIIHPVIRAERDFLVAAVDAAGAGVDQMLYRMMPAGLQDVVEPYHVTLDVCIRVLDTIADTSLCREVHDDIEVVLLEETVDEGLVGEVALDELVGVLWGGRGLLLNDAQAVLLERRIIVVIEVVEADDAERLLALQEAQDEVGAYETGGAGNKDGFSIL